MEAYAHLRAVRPQEGVEGHYDAAATHARLAERYALRARDLYRAAGRAAALAEVNLRTTSGLLDAADQALHG